MYSKEVAQVKRSSQNSTTFSRDFVQLKAAYKPNGEDRKRRELQRRHIPPVSVRALLNPTEYQLHKPAYTFF